MKKILVAGATGYLGRFVVKAFKVRGYWVRAKQAFVDDLKCATLDCTVVCPTGFFLDMEDFFSMARSGRVYLFRSCSGAIEGDSAGETIQSPGLMGHRPR